MKKNRILYSLVLGCVLLAAGCSSTEKGEKVVKAEPIVVETDNQTTRALNNETAAPVSSETQPKASIEEEQEVQPKETAVVSETPKSGKAEKKANQAVNAAAVDSIMDKKQPKPSAEKDGAAADKKTKITAMKALAKDLKQKAESKDVAQVKEIAKQLALAWNTSKSEVKTIFPDMHSSLEGKISELTKKVAADELDTEAIVALDYQIYQGFRQVLEKME